MKKIVKWYLSGFYKKPKGLKKPYNPILGETFRCYWEHPNGSKSYYIAEQGMHKVFSLKNFDFHYTCRFSFPVRKQSESNFGFFFLEKPREIIIADYFFFSVTPPTHIG